MKKSKQADTIKQTNDDKRVVTADSLVQVRGGISSAPRVNNEDKIAT